MEIERRIGDVAAACMRRQGFDYPDSRPTTGPQDRSSDSVFGTQEYAERHGFGVTDSYRQASEESTRDVNDDPLAEIVNGMNPVEQEAFFDALYGVDDQVDSDLRMSQTRDSATESQGCLDQAEREVIGDRAVLVELLGDELIELDERVQADSRTVELAALWSSCMANRGFPFNHPLELFSEVERRFVEILDDEQGLSNRQTNDGREGGAAEVGGGGIDLSLFSEAEAWEREVATADWECRSDHQIDNRLSAIRAEYERDFVEEFDQRLDAVVTESSG